MVIKGREKKKAAVSGFQNMIQAQLQILKVFFQGVAL